MVQFNKVAARLARDCLLLGEYMPLLVAFSLGSLALGA